MFANRFTAFVDACCLVDVLRRDLLLSLAEASFYGIRWSAAVLEERERALATTVLPRRWGDEAPAKAKAAIAAMVRAFEDATVTGFEPLIPGDAGLPDPGDAHVVAAAVKTRASVIVTENLRHFPSHILHPLDMEAKSADDFIADTIDLDIGRAVAAIRRMGRRYKGRVDGPQLLLHMEKRGLTQTVDLLRAHVAQL